MTKQKSKKPLNRKASGRLDKIGLRILHMRKARGLSIEALSKKTGLSIGLISGIERGKVRTSVRSIALMSEVLGVPDSWFDDTAAHLAGEVVRRSGYGRRIELNGGISKELLNPDLGGRLELLLVRISPGGSSGPESYTHHGEEAGVVLSGEFELTVDDTIYLLRPGDSFAFASDRLHRFGNPGKAETQLIWGLTPPLYQGVNIGDEQAPPPTTVTEDKVKRRRLGSTKKSRSASKLSE